MTSNRRQGWPWVLIVSLLAYSWLISAKIMITKVDYESDPTYLKMRVQINNETQGSTVDVDGFLFFDVNQGIFVNIELDSKMDGEYMTMIGTSKEMCVTDEGGLDPVVPMLNEEMDKYGNMSFSCPYLQGSYMLRRFHMSDDHMLVKMVPPGDYICKMNLQHQPENDTMKVQVFKLDFYFTIS
ncbi:uncharacterized protein LOC126577217 [Anopheles aquasalis]|uniref:uncharacterized protein LOC126577217 n=1 Tax=Anopheles aquasalis TaxID=42839 RepID=UPI00215B2841|nr:uncharacterized protein LOC126577217 [Anopheles aquasalis]